MISPSQSIFVTLLLLFFAFVCLSLPFNKVVSDKSFELSIIHFSDFHARYVPVSPSGGLCHENEKCVGGIARVANIVQRLKQIRKNAIFLNAGDCFEGTLYYGIYRGNVTAYFMNELPHDAMTIGNHDFDDEVSGLASFLKQLRAPIVATNIDRSQEAELRDLYTNSTVISKGGKNIGIIGAIFSGTDKISSTTGKVKFLNEVETINLEARKLKARGVNIILVLSHCGIDRDKIIASNCADVDVIVGGHSHILLYNGKAPSNDIVYDKYPVVISQKGSDRKVLIVHASAFTKYMGDIRIVFDEDDEVAHWEGDPIYLDSSVQEDQTIVKELEPWSIEVDKIGKRVIGETKVFLNDSCYAGECNLANLITDAMVYMYSTNSSIALTTALHTKNSIPVGPILYEDLYMASPYNGTWDLIELQGKDLLQVLEDNVAISSDNSSFVNLKLLHWSGLKVTYNLSNEKSKLVSAKIRCLECKGKFEDIDVNKWYPIVVSDYLLTAAFEIIAKKHRNRFVGLVRDPDNLADYMQKIMKSVEIKTEGRMIFL
ncbi:apyrase isoform X1 [Nasonia vitripennis]|uniref:Apyrase n=2 Tax=Nasonia vitripennis TaxID=7425 RepID=A0A7M7H7N0_NASVI|nr:apyrase isoform X1 [Nasonia vitripennis]